MGLEEKYALRFSVVSVVEEIVKTKATPLK